MLLLSMSAGPALTAAQTPDQNVTIGTSLVDDSGNLVGRVESIEGDVLIVRTDRHSARIPRSSVTLFEGRLLFALTRDELNAEIERSLAAAQANLTPGTPVRGISGSIAGTIEEREEGFIILRLVSGDRVRLPVTAIASGPGGAVLGLSASELQQLVDRASPSGHGT